MSKLNEEELLEELRMGFIGGANYGMSHEAYQQIKEMIKLFHSPLGHTTKYDPKEEWIRIK